MVQSEQEKKEKRREYERNRGRRKREEARAAKAMGSTDATTPDSLYRSPDDGTPDAVVTVEYEETPAKPDKKRGLFSSSPGKERTTKPRASVTADLTEGLEAVVRSAGAFVEERFNDPGVGRSIIMTSSIDAKLLQKTVARFPALHGFLAIFLGPGTMEAQAAFGIPMTIARMERHPETIPTSLPVLKSYMRPVLKDMVRTMRDEKKLRDEIEKLQAELGESMGMANFSVDKMILVELLGISDNVADGIIDKSISGADLARMAREAAPPPAEEPEE